LQDSAATSPSIIAATLIVPRKTPKYFHDAIIFYANYTIRLLKSSFYYRTTNPVFMKKLFYSLTAIATLALFSCGTGTEDLAASTSIETIVTKGNWSVNLYMDANQDKTNDFAGYNFVFEKGGKITATKNGVTSIGSWSENTFTNRLLLNFNATNNTLNNINDEWFISNISNKAVNCTNLNQGSNEVLGIAQQ
jgi:hypothetical protein